MTAAQPLTGPELIDCAEANAAQGVAVAAQLCGYEADTAAFMHHLKQACVDRGIAFERFSDLVAHRQHHGVEIAPDTQGLL